MPPSAQTVDEIQHSSERAAPGTERMQAPPNIDPRTLPPLTWHDVVGWIYLFPVRWSTRLLPVGLSKWLLRRLAWAHAWLRPGMTRTVRDAMHRAFADRDGAPAPADAARGFMARDFRKVGDDLLVHRIGLQELERASKVTGLEHLDTCLAEGRGAIVISGHFHANRLGKFYLRRRGYPMMSVRGRWTSSPFQGRFGHRYVAPAYHRFLSGNVEDELYAWSPDLGAGLLRRLRENGIVNIHIDAALSKERTYLPMLHLSWPVPVGFLQLAELSRAPLVPMLCLGDSDRFEIRFGEPIRFQGRSSGDATRQRLQTLVDRLQGWILDHPDQWEIWTRLDRYEKRYATR